jgi:hypothetical protein
VAGNKDFVITERDKKDEKIRFDKTKIFGVLPEKLHAVDKTTVGAQLQLLHYIF